MLLPLLPDPSWLPKQQEPLRIYRILKAINLPDIFYSRPWAGGNYYWSRWAFPGLHITGRHSGELQTKEKSQPRTPCIGQADAFVTHISPEYIINVVCNLFENKSGCKTAGSKETISVYVSQQE